MAVHAPDALTLLGQGASPAEQHILGAHTYSQRWAHLQTITDASRCGCSYSPLWCFLTATSQRLATRVISGLLPMIFLCVVTLRPAACSDIYLHRDPAYMPRNPAAWSAWNFLGSPAGKVSVTYWLNKLQVSLRHIPKEAGRTWATTNHHEPRPQHFLSPFGKCDSTHVPRQCVASSSKNWSSLLRWLYQVFHRLGTCQSCCRCANSGWLSVRAEPGRHGCPHPGDAQPADSPCPRRLSVDHQPPRPQPGCGGRFPSSSLHPGAGPHLVLWGLPGTASGSHKSRGRADGRRACCSLVNLACRTRL